MAHYFESPATDRHSLVTVRLALADRVVHLTTDVGVFSRSRVDPGTSVLLRTLPAPPATGDLLDLGCGYGPIALALAVQSPRATIWAVDVNERARALCAANAARNGLDNVQARAPEDVDAGIRFAMIASNPPIRAGKAALHELLGDWLPRLLTGGEAYLVVQKHLGSDSLQRWLNEQGWPTTRVASRQGFRVLRSSTPAGRRRSP